MHTGLIDFVITHSTCDNVQMLTVCDGLSDHHTVIVDANFSRTVVQSKHNVSYWKRSLAIRLRSHIESNYMSSALQSAYKQFHSKETALLKVHNGVTVNMDKGKVTALTLFDLSAAFDIIDYNILIKRLPV